MICNIDQFLLIVNKWVTESAPVAFVVRLDNESNEPGGPLTDPATA